MSDAERARRYRRHKAGDHSLCIQANCAAAGTRTIPPGKGSAPDSLGTAGLRLWEDMTASGTVTALHHPVLLEACRITDRLDQLDRQLRGEDWLRFRHDDSGAYVTVYVDKVLAEAREQATALKGLVVELRQSIGKDKPAQKGGGVLDDLAAKRQARRGNTAG